MKAVFHLSLPRRITPLTRLVRVAMLCISAMFVFGNPINAQDPQYRIVYQSIAWFPDGETIAFTAIRVKPDWSDYSADKWALFQYDLSAMELERLDSGSLYFSVSPDGTMLAYDKTRDGNADIFVRHLKTGETDELISGAAKDRAPAWSPDGREIVFYSDRTGRNELYVHKPGSGETVQTTDRQPYEPYNPVWSPHSGRIVFYGEKGDRRDQVFVVNRNGGQLQNISRDTHHNVYPSWTPDGRILYTRDAGEAVIMNADGTDKEVLLPGPVGQVRMHPDNNSLLITRPGGNLCVVDLGDAREDTILSGNELHDWFLAVREERPGKAPCIEYILSKDDSLGSIRNHDPETVSLSKAIRFYIKALRALDFSRCPAEFTDAFSRHIEAWEGMLAVTDAYPELRGEMHALFEILENREHREPFNTHLQLIWDTWAEVEDAVGKYGPK